MKLDSTILAALIAGAVALIVALITAWQVRRSARRDLDEAIAATQLLEHLEGHYLSDAVEKRRDVLLRRWSKWGRRDQILAAMGMSVLLIFIAVAIVAVGEPREVPEPVVEASQWIVGIVMIAFVLFGLGLAIVLIVRAMWRERQERVAGRRAVQTEAAGFEPGGSSTPTATTSIAPTEPRP